MATAPFDPLALIGDVFQRACRGGYDPAWLDGVAPAFLARLGDDDAALAAVPVLTAAALRARALAPGQLVRYVGLVQDQFDPEFYAAAAELRDASGAARLAPLAYTSFEAPAAPGAVSVELRSDVMERRCVGGARRRARAR